MGHQVYRTNGKDSMAWTLQKPWHGLGQEVDPNATVDEWAKAAQLEWEVLRSNITYTIPKGGFRDSDIALPYSDRQVLYRSDNYAPLHTVSAKYKIVQPLDVLGFYRELVTFLGYKIETAGSLDMGRRVWALAKTGQDIDMDGDKVEGYLLLATAYDASFSTTAQFTSVRVVCNNTLGAALEMGNQRMVRIPHYCDFNHTKVKADLGILAEVQEGFADKCWRLASLKLDDCDAAGVIWMAVGEQERAFETTWELYKGGPGCEYPTAKNTAWGVINAITCYADHYKPARSSNNRLRSAWFGPSFEMKRMAWDSLVRILR